MMWPLITNFSLLPQSLVSQYTLAPVFSFTNVMPYVRSLVGASSEVESFGQIVKLIFTVAWKYYKLPLILSVIFALIASQLSVASPRYVKQLTDLFTERPETLRADFLWLLFLVGLTRVGSELISTLSYRATFYMATQTEDAFRFAALRQYFSLPNDVVEQSDSGQIGSQVERGGSSIWMLLHNILGHDILPSTISLISVQISAYQAAPELWWLFVLPVPFHLWLSSYHQSQVGVLMVESNSAHEEASQSLYDGLSNIRVVKSFGKETYEASRYAARWAAYHSLQYRMDLLDFRRLLLQNLIKIIGLSALLYCCYDELYEGTMTVGTLGMLMSYQTMIYTPLSGLANFYARAKRISKRAVPMLNILHEQDSLKDSDLPRTLTPLKNSITIDNVSFSYSNGKQALKEVSLTIPSGHTVALVGRSGSGKSTTTALLQRFYDPTVGNILWDGVKLSEFSRDSLRKHICLVPQDTSLFNRSIKENIAYGRPDATLDEVIEAAKKAHAHDFITNLPKQYESIVGERGTLLSGGERQRIAIARVFVLQPSLLILDESTSQLDSESEASIQASFKTVHESEITTVVIAHRLSTILHAQTIVVLDEGKVVGSGTHTQLLQTCPPYQRLHQLQFKDQSN